MDNKKIEIDVIILSYSKDDEMYHMTYNAIQTLTDSESQFKFNVFLIETNKNFHKDYPGGYHATIIIPDGEFNYNKFLNIGLTYCKSEIIVVSNNDVVFHKNWFSEIYPLIKEGKMDSASPCFDHWYQANEVSIPTDIWYGYEICRQVWGFCIVAKKEVYDKIGKFDEEFVFWCQDDDYAMQLQKYNFKHALVRKSKITHFESRSWKFLSEEEKDFFTIGMKELFKEKYTMKINVITRVSRVDDLLKIMPTVLSSNVHWHLVFDISRVESVKTELLNSLKHPDISLYFEKGLPNIEGQPCDMGHELINRIFDKIADNEWVYVLDDDNIIHPDFFSSVREVIKNTDAEGIIFSQVYGKESLIREALPENVKVCHIDMAQFLLKKSLIKQNRLVNYRYEADGIFIEKLFNENKEKFCFQSKVLCYYNFLES